MTQLLWFAALLGATALLGLAARSLARPHRAVRDQKNIDGEGELELERLRSLVKLWLPLHGPGLAEAPLPAAYFGLGLHGEAIETGQTCDRRQLLCPTCGDDNLNMCHLVLAVAPRPHLTDKLQLAREHRNPHHANMVRSLTNMVLRGSTRVEVCTALKADIGRHSVTDRQALLVLVELAGVAPSQPRNNRCAWVASEAVPQTCRAQLLAHFGAADKDNTAAQAPTSTGEAILLGDSTMWRLWINGGFPGRCGSARLGGRCGILRAMGMWNESASLPAGVAWRPPVQGLEGGPEDEPFCSMCNGCDPAVYECPAGRRPSEGLAWSYLGVEFARDIEYPSAGPGFRARTTQESVAVYLDHHPKELCVVNAGLHDMTIGRHAAGPDPCNKTLVRHMYNHSTASHVENVRQYVALLQKGCRRTVWLTTSAIEVPEGDRWPQRNWRAATWNGHVEAVLQSEFPAVFFVDVFPKTAGTKHLDNVHLDNTYYVTLGQLFQDLHFPIGRQT